VDKLVFCLAGSGLALKYYFNYTHYIFPAPCLSDEIIESLVKPLERPLERAEAKPSIPPPPKPERFDVKPSREVLKGIVASVFEDLGFNVITKREERVEESESDRGRCVGFEEDRRH
jgi:hypothetical protein